MRSTRTVLSVAVAAAVALAVLPAGADPSDPPFCNTADGSSSNQQIVDPANDYEGIVGGNGGALVPYGDVNGAGTDIIGGWVGPNADGKVEATIALAGITGLEVNANWALEWTYETTPGDPQALRYVSAQVQRPIGGVMTPQQPIYRFEFGYIDTASTPNLITNQGTTTGQIVPGTPGLIKIVVPLNNRLGSPPPGATLQGIEAVTRVLIGAQGTGLLGVADSALGFPCIDLVVA